MAYSTLEILRRIVAIANYLDAHKGDKPEAEVLSELVQMGYTRSEIAAAYYYWLNQEG